MSSGFAAANGIESSKTVGSFRLVEWGDASDSGSQLRQCSKSLAKSAQISEKMQNSCGQGEPPNVNLTLERVNSLNIIVHFSAMPL